MEYLDATYFLKDTQQALTGTFPELQFRPNTIGQALGITVAVTGRLSLRSRQQAGKTLAAPDLQIVVLLTQPEELRLNICGRIGGRFLSPQNDLAGNVPFTEEETHRASVEVREGLELTEAGLALPALVLRQGGLPDPCAFLDLLEG